MTAVTPNGGRLDSLDNAVALAPTPNGGADDSRPAGPAVNCKRLLCQLATSALAHAAPGRAEFFAAAVGDSPTYPVVRGGAQDPDVHTAPEKQTASILPSAAVEPMLGQSA